MDATKDRRRSPRLYVTLPATYQVLPAKNLEIPKGLAEVYERVPPISDDAGENLQGMVRDLSANGAFITGPTVPLLSRILLTFPLPGMAKIEAIGWVLWRRSDDCTVEKRVPGKPDPVEVTLRTGFGILFEAIPAKARRHIHRLAKMNTSSTKLKTVEIYTPRPAQEDLGGAPEAEEDLDDVEEIEEVEEVEEVEEMEEGNHRDHQSASGEIGGGGESNAPPSPPPPPEEAG